MKINHSFAIVLILVWMTAGTAVWGAIQPGSIRLDAPADPNDRLASNSVIDIVPLGSDLWFGTGQGLNQLHLESGGWTTISESDGIGHGGVSALAVNDTIIWIATAYSENTAYGIKSAGGGIGFSRDQGVNWIWMPQPVDSAGITAYHPTTTNIQNVTYDITLSDSAVWIVSYGGGLRKLTYENINQGQYNWQVVPPDTMPFWALNNYNHRGFSAAYDGASLWVGTAQGINRSVDEGQTWGHYTHTSAASGNITGNFVTALAAQTWNGVNRLWAATWKAEGGSEYYGISVTDNGGLTWQAALSDSSYSSDDGTTWQTVSPGALPPAATVYLVDTYGNLKVHNFGFQDSLVWAAADRGLWLSRNQGQTWSNWAESNEILDPTLGEQLRPTDFYAVAGSGDSLWIGTDDGVAKGWPEAGGFTWRIHRAYTPAGVSGEPDTYAYPNPFSPVRGHLTRIQVPAAAPAEASYTIYNFAMEKAFESSGTLLPGSGTGDMAGYGTLVWDGRNAQGKIVANGTYFYRVKVGGKSYWGKVMVLD